MSSRPTPHCNEPFWTFVVPSPNPAALRIISPTGIVDLDKSRIAQNGSLTSGQMQNIGSEKQGVKAGTRPNCGNRAQSCSIVPVIPQSRRTVRKPNEPKSLNFLIIKRMISIHQKPTQIAYLYLYEIVTGDRPPFFSQFRRKLVFYYCRIKILQDKRALSRPFDGASLANLIGQREKGGMRSILEYLQREKI